jgi:integrase
MNTTVNLTKYVPTEKGWRYCPVIYGANGRVRPHVVQLEGSEQRIVEGAYYIEWRDPARKRERVGTDAAEADARKRQKEAELKARREGLEIAATTPNRNGRRSIAAAVQKWLGDIELRDRINKPQNYGRHSTHGLYSKALEYFLESLSKTYLEDLERNDLLRFAVFLQEEKEYEPRTVSHRFDVVMAFLKAQGITNLISKGDRPKFTEAEPDIYEQDELTAFFAACDPEEKIWFSFFLMTGMREQEVRFMFKSDVNLKAHTVRVRHKVKPWNWSPKRYKEREIPIPDALVKMLESWIAKCDKNCPLLFSTSGCKPKMDFWDCAKAIARRAKLDEGKVWLHKFRSTFATRALEATHGHLPTVQLWLGHSDVESTMRYLKPSRSVETHQRVNAMFPNLA